MESFLNSDLKEAQGSKEAIKEALHIKFKKPTINRQLFSQGSSFVLNVF